MNELKVFASEQIKKIVPTFGKLELRATIGDTSRAIEFFVMINGERKQCYELVNEGVISEEALDKALNEIAQFIRTSPDYKKSEVNKVAF